MKLRLKIDLVSYPARAEGLGIKGIASWIVKRFSECCELQAMFHCCQILKRKTPQSSHRYELAGLNKRTIFETERRLQETMSAVLGYSDLWWVHAQKPVIAID